jgi:hypothetical protein
VNHLRSFCAESSWPRGELNLPRALLTEKAFPEDEVMLTSEIALRGPLAVDNQLIFEKRVGPLDQLELLIPFSVRDQGGNGEAAARTLLGVGDVAVGWKRVLWHSLPPGFILSVMGELFLPFGSQRDGFGAGTFAFEPSVMVGQMVGDVGFVQLQSGLELPFDTGLAKNGFYARGALGANLSEGGLGRMWSPMVELMASRELEAGARTDWDYVPELQVTLSRRRHVRGCAGVRMPLTRLDERPMTTMLYLLWDWYDGGLLEGW